MQRYKLTIEYDGTPYSGWQRQENAPSIQAEIEEALSKFCSQKEIEVYGSGRTDAGVHAGGQVAHVDLEEALPCPVVKRALNAHLRPRPIVVLDVEAVEGTFHARFSALSRSYRYVVVNRGAPLALERERAWQVPFNLQLKPMQEAAVYLLGKHDFTSFRTVHCQSKDPVKTLSRAVVDQEDDHIFFNFNAPSFLHHQVRTMVGTLVEIGRLKHPPSHIKMVLEAKDRAKAGPTAPAHGLYLTRIFYS